MYFDDAVLDVLDLVSSFFDLVIGTDAGILIGLLLEVLLLDTRLDDAGDFVTEGVDL